MGSVPLVIKQFAETSCGCLGEYFLVKEDRELLLVEDKVEALPPIIGKARVAGDKRHMERHGVGNDDVVAGVFVVLCRIEAKPRIGLHHLFLYGQNLDVVVLLNGINHVLSRFPPLVAPSLGIIGHNEFTHALGTDA